MKALTICQPYAHLIVVGQKRVENREWWTAHRGPLAIHAGLSHTWLQGHRPTPDMAFGAFVGVAELVDCVHIDCVDEFRYRREHPWLAEHPHTQGTWCWVLANVTRLATPIPWKGAQGLWNCPDQVINTALLGEPA